MRFKEYAEQWLKMVSVRESTLAIYRGQVRTHLYPTFGHLRVAEVTRPAVKAWLAEMKGKAGPGTVRNAWSRLKSICDEAVDDGFLASNPCEGVKKHIPQLPAPKAKPTETELIGEAVAELKTKNARLHLVPMIQAETGLRIGEVVALKWANIDLEKRLIAVKHTISAGQCLDPKTRKGFRSRPISQALATDLLKHGMRYGRGEFLFTNPATETHYSTGHIGSLWREACRAVGATVTGTHGLRHWYTHMRAARGDSIKSISDALGHASVQVTEAVYLATFQSAPEPDTADDLRSRIEKLHDSKKILDVSG